MIQFEHKFGWSEVIALVALLGSAIALWQVRESSRPLIAVEALTPTQILNADGQRRDTILVGFPLILTNHGGRPGSLLQFIHAAEEPLALRAYDGAEFKDDPALEVSYVVLDQIANSRDELAIQLTNNAFLPLTFPQILNLLVESGTSRTLTIGIRIRDKHGKALNDSLVAFSMLLLFSDGTTYRLAQAFEPEQHAEESKVGS